MKGVNEWLRVEVVRDDYLPFDGGSGEERWVAHIGTPTHYLSGKVELHPSVRLAEGKTKAQAMVAAFEVLKRLSKQVTVNLLDKEDK